MFACVLDVLWHLLIRFTTYQLNWKQFNGKTINCQTIFAVKNVQETLKLLIEYICVIIMMIITMKKMTEVT